MELLYKEESYAILGACFDVYTDKGCGFLEAVYQECLAFELGFRGIPCRQQVELKLSYKGCELRSKYQPDFICYDKIILELKSVTKLADEHRAQVHNYLKATNHRLGLLVNFGHYPKLEHERNIR